MGNPFFRDDGSPKRGGGDTYDNHFKISGVRYLLLSIKRELSFPAWLLVVYAIGGTGTYLFKECR